ncbi:hypothetical protein [Loktanella sp. Alg231-35]|uniref:hypothetical protein n=1 Tax=Loktanella sp. Alg231-35 TaxID=1922220 RepID=UPI000D558132|nr:hypothetical protein [Loktanella sp. Alg231-35]
MLKFWARLFKSSKFMNRLADEIGVDRQIYKSALTEVGTNFANYEAWFRRSSEPEAEILRELATASCEPAAAGAKRLKVKFPKEQSIDRFLEQISRYNEGLSSAQMEESMKTRDASKATSELPGTDTAMQIIFMQLPLCGLDPMSLCARLKHDSFALGYVFGVADMANYQFNQPLPDGQVHTLDFIRHVFVETLGGEGEERFDQALQSQAEPEFASGRQGGANDLGNWLKSRGQVHAVGLSRHVCSN